MIGERIVLGPEMVMKTFIFATCAALFAGGVVYFGTDAVENGGSARVETGSVNESTSDSKEIISRYIGASEKVVADTDQDEAVNPYEIEDEGNLPHPPKENASEASKLTDDVDVTIETDPVDQDIEIPQNSMGEVTEKLNLNDDALDKTVSAESAETQSIGSQTAEKEDIREVATPQKPKPAQTAQEKGELDDDPAQLRVNAVFEQAENISQPDLRDRAYLDLADYATGKGLFKDAEKAALKIQQVELRDTARSRIAMGLARYGKSDEAFSLIEDVEIDELRDVMRLQVIEALLGTDGRR